MAEIKVAIKGDDDDLKRKFRESAAAAGLFSEHVKEQLDKIKDAAADVAGETGFGGIKSVLTGLGGIAFGAAIVDGFKEAALAAIEFEKKVVSLKFALGPAQGGLAPDLAKWVESYSGAMGDADTNMEVFGKLLKANNENIELSKSQLIDLQNAAAKMGVNVRDLGEAFADMKLEGEIRPRFFREFPEIAKQVRELIGMPAPAPGTTAEQAEESINARVKAAGGVDWLFKAVLPQIAPGGLQSSVRRDMEQSAAGQLADLNEQFKQLSIEFGHELLPGLKDFANWFKSEMPVITEDFKALGAAIEATLNFFHGLAPGLSPLVGKPTGPFPGYSNLPQVAPPLAGAGAVWDFLREGWENTTKPMSEATGKLNDSADKLHRALSPY